MMTGDVLLAPLRTDVEVLAGPAEDDGSPTAILHDRLSGTFDRLGWRELEVVRRLDAPVRFDDLAARLGRETTATVSRPELTAFLSGLHARGLLKSALFRSPAALLAEAEKAKVGPVAWLLRHYLFFRVPLLRPDGFLRSTLWVPAFLGSWFMSALYMLVAVAAVFLFIPRSGVFWEDAMAMLAWRSAPQITLAVIAIKVCHEFAHAYAARVRGAEVRSMGVAFMLFAPIPYTDVTDAWRLGRRARLGISIAGVRAELIVAAFALLGWSLFPPGRASDVCLLLSSVSIVSTLATNLNPGMRFDGYYLLSDLLGVDNLQNRGFAHAGRFYRRFLLGLESPGGEPALGWGKRAALIAYAIYACLYRLVLYFGIAVLVYRHFPKAIGIALFAVEIVVFIVRPVWRETGEIIALFISGKKGSVRTVGFILAAAALVFWLAWPMPRRLRLDAITVPSDETVVFIPDSGILVANNLRRGAIIPAGEVLVAVENAALDAVALQADLDMERAGMSLDIALAGGTERPRIREQIADAERVGSVVSRLASDRAMNVVRAEGDSLVLEVERTLVPGVHVARRAVAGRVVPTEAGTLIVAYVPENYVNDLRIGDAAAFVPAAEQGVRIPAAITAIQANAARRVGEPALTVPYGGAMPAVKHADGSVSPATTSYRITAEPAENGGGVRLGQIGELRVESAPRSYLYEGLVWLYRLLLRESGF